MNEKTTRKDFLDTRLPTTWRARFDRLVFELWCDGILTEQQCANYAGTDIVSVRRTLDSYALLLGFKSREDAQT